MQSDAKAFEERLTKIGWKRAVSDSKSDAGNEYIAVPASEDNAISAQKEPGTASQATERIRFEQIAKVLTAFS